MKPFTKNEVIGTLIILILIFAISLFNFRTALRRSRDAQRREDLSAISNALGKFYEDFGYFPPDDDGKIKMCKADNFEQNLNVVEAAEVFDRQQYFEGLRPCKWGEDSFDDLLDDEYAPYLARIPQDPQSDAGISYLYISNMRRFQLYSHLEGGFDEEGYSNEIVNRELLCGNKICSFGKSFAETPLNKSIEEYERELEILRLEKQQQKML